MKKVLILVDWYLPGYKAGGQIQSCANLAHALKDKVELLLLTSDRDLGDHLPYAGIRQNEWLLSPYGYKIQYLSPENIRYSRIKNIIKETEPDCIYLNSMFSLHFTILAIAAVVYTPSVTARVVLAPRGMLHDGALQFKKIKKQFFLKAFRMLQWHRKIVFHATDIKEQTDIKLHFGKKSIIEWVNDFPSQVQREIIICDKKPGSLRCIFVSRISPKKNLLYLLSRLSYLKGDVDLTIIGPVEDELYWKECQLTIQKLPENITVHYLGAVPNEQLDAHYVASHLFFLPTHGENFGHVIFESLLCGRPVLISDNTPWNVNETGKTGWSIALTDTEAYINALMEAIAWDQDTFNAYCSASWHYAAAYINGAGLTDKYIKLLVA